MTNFEMLTAADIAARGNLMLDKDNRVDPNSLSTEDKLENLSVLVAYKEMLDERFAEALKLYEDSIDINDFDGTYNVGNLKITFKVKEVITAKAIGFLGILQAKIMEWVAMPSSRESSQPRDGTCIS